MSMNPGKRGMLFLLFFSLALPLQTVRAQSITNSRLEVLNADLEKVRDQLASATRDLRSSVEALWRQQHDVEYSDPEIKKIHDEITVLEKQMLQKREFLNARRALLPEIKKLEDQRKELYTRLDNLQAQEKQILNEIKTEQNTGGVEKK